jgi:hypothetical protein
MEDDDEPDRVSLCAAFARHNEKKFKRTDDGLVMLREWGNGNESDCLSSQVDIETLRFSPIFSGKIKQATELFMHK